MKLRDGNIIVCTCGVELNPETTTPQDFIKYANGIAICSNCGSSGAIEIPTPVKIDVVQGQPTTAEELDTALNNLKGELGLLR